MSVETRVSSAYRRIARCSIAGALAATALAGSVHAHLGDLSYSEIAVEGVLVFYKLRFAAHLIPGTGPATAERLTRQDIVTREDEITAWLASSLRVEMAGRSCEAALVDSVGPDESDDLTVVLRFKCPQPSKALRIEFRAFDETLPDFQNIASIRHEGVSAAFVFTRSSRILTLGGSHDEPQSANFLRFLALGIEHIVTGYDHLAFLLALLLPGGSIGRLAAIVTAFTIAHSITLALAALDVFTLPAPPVEAAIAASVVFAALDAIARGPRDHRTVLTFAFGLVHGFGFAGILRQTGLPTGAATVPLLAFNAGVEVGQLAVVFAVVPLLRAATTSARGRTALLLTAWGIAAVGTFWLVERLAAWLAP